MITVKRESWLSAKSDVMPLIHMTHSLVEKKIYNMPLDLDDELLQELENSNTFHLIVMRKDGEAIGFHSLMIAPLLRFKDKYHAYSDSIFVHHEHRNHSMQLIGFSEQYIQDFGCISWVLASLDPEDRAKLWQRKGFQKAETIFIKVF